MHLTLHADYTMRLLIHLAVQEDESATIQQIAAHYGISRHHLVKVAHEAVQAGYVESVRGRAGGLKLARKPREIRIGAVLRAVEDWRVVECLERTGNGCRIAPACGLKPALREATQAFLSVLDRYTLADVARRRGALVQLLA